MGEDSEVFGGEFKIIVYLGIQGILNTSFHSSHISVFIPIFFVVII
jgi:hypothetical protein